MLGILKRFNLFVFLIIVLLGAFLWFVNILFGIKDQFILKETLMPVMVSIISIFHNDKIFLQLVSFVLIIFQGIYIINLNKKYIFLESQTYLPLLIFFFITGIYRNNHLLNPVIISNMFLLFSFNKIFNSYKNENNFSDYFEASFLISIGSMFYLYFGVFIIVLWIGMSILRSFNIREWIISLIGFVLPYLLAFGYFFLVNKHISFLKALIDNFSFHPALMKAKISLYIIYSFIALLIIISMMLSFSGYNIKKIRTRKYFIVLAWCFPVVIFLSILRPFAFEELFFFLSFPASLFIANLLMKLRYKWVSEVVFIIFFVLIVLDRFVSL